MRRRALGPSICRVWRCPSLEIESWAAGQLPELRRALTRSLLEHMVDMSAGYCDTGCVQRILYCVDGVDLTLLPGQPTADVIRDEIATIAGLVNNRYESLYGAGESDPKVKVARDASTSGEPALSSRERKVISRYQGKRPIDEGLSIRLKQDMLEAAVVADLVERLGWSAAAVRPELDRMKAFMNDL